MAEELKTKNKISNAEKDVKTQVEKAAAKPLEGNKISEKKPEAKTDKKQEIKPEKKTESAADKKEDAKKTETKTGKKEEAKKPAVVKKFIPYVKKENKAKSKEARENQKKLAIRKHTPVFRGRFGKKNIRRKSIAKWDKWRKPHGIDLDKGLQHGFRPKIGYRSRIDLRNIHPSGYMEAMVCNFNDLAKINNKTHAARISRTLGKRKRNEIIKKANELGIWVLN